MVPPSSRPSPIDCPATRPATIPRPIARRPRSKSGGAAIPSHAFAACSRHEACGATPIKPKPKPRCKTKSRTPLPPPSRPPRPLFPRCSKTSTPTCPGTYENSPNISCGRRDPPPNDRLTLANDQERPMPQMNMVQAINDGLRLEMRRDPRVVVMGEDVGKVGGVFRVTSGLFDEFGEDRVIDTPLAEGGIVGTAIGMALYGLVPVPEIQFADFIYPAYDQIVSELAKLRYRSGGEYPAKLVIRTPVGGGIRGGHYHSQSPEAQFIHVAGLKVVCPASPADAKGLLLSSIRDPDPVIFFEPKRIYRAAKGDVPEADYTVPLSKAALVREGNHVTVIAWGAMLYEALEAANQAAAQGIECDVIDLRTLWPLDIDAIVASVKKTGRVVVVHEAPRTCGFGSEIITLINEKAFLYLEAPPARVTGIDTPFPSALEMEYLPLAHRILPAIVETARY